MYYECCVCKSSRQDAILYHFPATEKRRKVWLKFLNRGDLKELSAEQLSKLFVCQKHFEKKFITAKFRLLGNAYPSLFSGDEISSGIPSQEFTENVDPNTEHSYSRKRHYDHTYSRLEPLRETTASIFSDLHNLPGPSQNPTAVQYSENIVNIPSAARDPLDEQLPVGGLRMKTKIGSRRRLVRKIKDLTPTGQIIYKEFKKAKQQVDFLKRAKRASKLSKEKAFENMTKNMNPYAKRIMEMQINLCTKNKKGYRFSLQEKLISLSIMKQSPKGYRFLRKIFILPSRSTLNKMVSKLNVQTGICPQVFELLKKEVAEWDDKKKWCSIVFDEMSLDTALNYDKKRDSIVGFVELQEKKKQFADHALVFMLRGAIYKWQQPIAFYYCEGATSGIELKSILKDVTAAVVNCGLKPVALICDQGAAFQSALKSLKEDTRRDQILANQEPDGTVTISGVNLNIIYDPSHLIKGLRNNFLTKNISMDGKISKWSDIVDVYQTDCNHTEVRLLHKLNDQHVIPEKIKKMKVKNCVKVFSSTMSAALSYTAKFYAAKEQKKRDRGARESKTITVETYASVLSGPNSVPGILPTSSRRSPPEGSADDDETISFFCGNPLVEVTKGVLHLYKENELKEAAEEAKTLCLLSVPGALGASDLLAFVAACQQDIAHVRVFRDGSPDHYMALLTFRSSAAAREFYSVFDGVPYSSLEPAALCHVAWVARVEWLAHGAPPAAHTELPTCPVCLERMDESVAGVLSVQCAHAFHALCLVRWHGARCPVCRCAQTPEPRPEARCAHCDEETGADEDGDETRENISGLAEGLLDGVEAGTLWICLICGHVGCGRYEGGHAAKHFLASNHTYALQLGSNRVWDYAGDNFVHRLVQNKADGKLVASDGAAPGEACGGDKLDSAQLEFTYMLTTQLDRQRAFYEDRIAKIESERAAECEQLRARATAAENNAAALKEQVNSLTRENKALDKKLHHVTNKLSVLQSSLSEERGLAAALASSQAEWQAKAKAREEGFVREVAELKEQLRDVMFFVEARGQLEQAGATSAMSAAELADATVSVGAPPKPRRRRR